MQETTLDPSTVDIIDTGLGHLIAVPKEAKPEPSEIEIPPVRQLNYGSRQVRARARAYKELKRKAVTAMKRELGRRLTPEEMNVAKRATVEWMAQQIATS